MKSRRMESMFLFCAVLASALSAVGQTNEVTAMSSPKALTLLNGWYNSPYSTSKAEVVLVDGIVHLKGAIAGTGANDKAFVLPAGYRPSKYVDIKVDVLGAQNGRLVIYPNGDVWVGAENGLSVAKNFTSLDGASFALSASGFKTLSLENGWKNYSSLQGTPGVKNINGIVHFRGAMKTAGTNTAPFVLPAGYRPAKLVQLAVDLCGATEGQLTINPDGTTHLKAETEWSNAQCFTSLDGVWFAVKDTGFTTLSLINGWTNGASSYQPAAKLVNGIVSFVGLMYAASNTTSADVAVLPSSMTPTTNVYIPVDLSEGSKGRINISPDGYVTVQAAGSFTDARSFTSLDGASFVKQ